MSNDLLYESSDTAERAFIGRLVLTPREFHDHDIRSSEFGNSTYRRIHQAMAALWTAGTEPDPVAIEDWTQCHGEQIGALMIARISDDAEFGHNMANLVRIIRDAAMDRRTRSIAEDLAKSNLRGRDLLASAMSAFNNVGVGDDRSWSTIKDIVTGVTAEAELREQGIKGDEIVTSVEQLDDMGLLERGGILTIGGRPSMCKSALAQYLTVKWAENGERVAVFSTETSERRLGKRYLAGASGINFRDIGRTGPSSAATWRALVDGAAHLSTLGIWIDDHSHRAGTIVRAIRRARQQFGITIVVIDYLQRCIPDVDPRKEINQLLAAVIEACRESNPPIGMVLLSQLGRSVEKRPDKKPRMPDLLESGRIEADSDVILFPFRPYYYCQQGEDMYKNADPMDLYLTRAKARDDLVYGQAMLWDNLRGQVIGPKPGPSERPTQEDLL